MFKPTLLILVIFSLLAGSVLPTAADGPDALDWLRDKQADDGGFAGDFEDTSSLGATVEAVFAIVALDEDPNAWSKEGDTPVTFLQAKAVEITLPGDLAKTILAAVAADANPRDFGGVDLITNLEAQYDPASGLYGGTELGNVFGQSLAIMALTATGREVPPAAADWLLSRQLDDGSWSWNGETTPGSGDSNSTAIALQALLAGGYSGDAVANALAYFAAQQNDDGGFTYQKPSDFGTATDANSTAYVIQALLAAGEDLSAWAKDGLTPPDTLLTLQKETGAFQWQAALEDENFLSTMQAVPALANRSFAQVAGSIDAGPPAQLPQSGAVLLLPLWAILSGFGLLGIGWIIKRNGR